MKLKCIGGPENGTIVETENHFMEHDQVPVMARVEFSVFSFEEDLKAYREGRTPDSMCNQYYHYKIAVVRFSKTSQLSFLTPMNWTQEDAIRFMLGC